MLKYVLKRLVQLIPILFIVSIIIFGMVRMSNINPVSVIVGEKRSTPQVIAEVREKYNLNKPLPEQYLIWISGLLKGNLGVDYKNKQPVSDLILQSFPVTAGLVILSSLLSILIAIPIGIVSAVKKNTWVDSTLSVLTLIFVSSPGFLTGIIMIMITSVIAPNFSFTGTYSSFGEYFQRISLPSLALAFCMIALISRVTRSSMIEQRKSGYFITSEAKGLPPQVITFKHCFKNAVIPVITIFGIQIGGLISGAVVVENVFSLPGIGSLLIDGINQGNYPVVEDVTLMLVFVFLLLSMLVDVVYALIDPRIRTK